MKFDHVDDAMLIRQIANEQQAGIEALYDRYYRLVFSVAPTNTGPGDFPGGEIRGQVK